MAARSSIFVWKIQWTEEPHGLQSTGSQSARHEGSNRAHEQAHIHHIKLTTLTILSVQFSGILYICIAAQPSPPSISRTFSSSQTATVSP